MRTGKVGIWIETRILGFTGICTSFVRARTDVRAIDVLRILWQVEATNRKGELFRNLHLSSNGPTTFLIPKASAYRTVTTTYRLTW